MTVTLAHLHVASGAGVLMRSDDAVCFVSSPAGSAIALIDAFTGADNGSAIDAVTAAATDAGFAVPAFVVVEWSSQLQVVAFGDIEVRTDHPTMPMLSGAGSTSWVERTLRSVDATVVVEVGDAPDPTTELGRGRVTAGGFTAVVVAREAADRSAPQANASVPREPPVVAPVSPPPEPTAPTVGQTAPSPETTSVPKPVDPTAPLGQDRLAALRSAMGAPSPAAAEPAAPDETPAVAPVQESVPDDEVTWAPIDAVAPTDRAGDEPGDTDAHDDDDDERPFVVATACPRGHLNPAQVGVCRRCGDLMAAGAPPQTIRQPALALLDLGVGTPIPIDRSLVLGRRPDIDAAGAPPRARSVVVGDDASISRTHLRVDVEDWSMTVTDCGSRGGTAIVVRPGDEPRILEPWLAHELPIGARLFLGGPTSVVIRPITSNHPGGRAG